MSKSTTLIPVERIENKILLIRGQKVMLDRDLAELYGTGTREINRAVNRNLERFPEDFSFKLTKPEMQNLMFHFGTSSWGGVRKLPRVFTEQGAAMLSSVLKSYRAILAKFGDCLDKHDVAIIEIFEAIKKLMTPEEKPTKRIGFIVD